MRRKLNRKTTKITIDIFSDQIEDMDNLFPGVPRTEIIRGLLDRMLRIIKEGRAKAEATGLAAQFPTDLIDCL